MPCSWTSRAANSERTNATTMKALHSRNGPVASLSGRLGRLARGGRLGLVGRFRLVGLVGAAFVSRDMRGSRRADVEVGGVVFGRDRTGWRRTAGCFAPPRRVPSVPSPVIGGPSAGAG